MIDDRIPTTLWVEAHLAGLNARGIPYYIANKGAHAGGMVLLKLNGLAGYVKLLTQQRDLDGVLGWANALGEDLIEERTADEYTARAIDRDPDLWVIEIEDRTMVNPFDT